MIFPEHQAIFFHVGRTGGTSVEQMLSPEPRDEKTLDRERLFGPDPREGIFLQHATCETTRRLVGEERFAAYYKLTIVRNPFTRLVSVYYYNFHRLRRQLGTFEAYVRALPSMAADRAYLKGSHEIAQRHYTHIGGDQVVDAILRFEELPGCIEPVRARLGIAAALPATNETRYPSVVKKPTAAHYDAGTIEVMRRVYAEDFALYGYPDTP
jgi:hypothetical protein